jgi:hypothetical protein
LVATDEVGAVRGDIALVSEDSFAFDDDVVDDVDEAL